MIPRRGNIYWVDFDPIRGSEEGSRRPALVIQNDIGNQYSETTIVLAITSKLPSKKYPFHVWLPDLLPRPSVILCEQIRTVSIERFDPQVLAVLPQHLMSEVERAICHSLALPF